MPRREQPEEQSGAERHTGRKEQHRTVRPDVQTARRVARQHPDDDVEGPPGDQQARQPSAQREHEGFGEQLPHELTTPGAVRKADRHLVGPRGSSRQQQVRNVRAGDQQHEPCDAEQEQQRGSGLAIDRALPAGSLFHFELPGLEPRHRRVTHSALERCFHLVDDCAVLHVQLGPRLLERDPRTQPREHVGPVGAAIVEAVEPCVHEAAKRDRHVHLRGGSQRGALETFGGHPHDGEVLAIDDQDLVQDLGAAVEARGPVGVAQDRDK